VPRQAEGSSETIGPRPVGKVRGRSYSMDCGQKNFRALPTPPFPVRSAGKRPRNRPTGFEVESKAHEVHPDAEVHWTESGPDYTTPDYLADWAKCGKDFTGKSRQRSFSVITTVAGNCLCFGPARTPTRVCRFALRHNFSRCTSVHKPCNHERDSGHLG